MSSEADIPSLTLPAPPEGGPDAESVRAKRAFEASQTFLVRSPDPNVVRLRVTAIAVVLLVFFAVIPLLDLGGFIADYRINFLGKYLCFAIVALGIDLIWGYTGLLSLCQALFFCLGGYIMAMHLSLKEGGGDVRPEFANLPAFLSTISLRELPGFWLPFKSMTFTLIAGLVLPTLAAAIFGFFILRSRVRGVYFSIITQALAWATWLLISRNEMRLGGSNGLTNFYKPLNSERRWIIGLYLATLTILLLAYLVCRVIVKSRLGRVLVAVRDKETRLYFAGYKPYAFKVFAFSVGALLAAVGGMLYSPQVGIITPQNMNVEASIVMVIWVALGGRGRLWGAIFGALLVNVLLSSLSSDLSFWLLIEGCTFIGVVLFFPDGFVGIWEQLERRVTQRAALLQIVLTALPLVIISVYVLAEVLGLMPAMLRKPVSSSASLQVPWKYVLLVALLAANAGWLVQLALAEKAARGAKGFLVGKPATGGRL